jgi:hypothetical protein
MKTIEALERKYGNPMHRDQFEAKHMFLYHLPTWLYAYFPTYNGRTVSTIFMNKDLQYPLELVMKELISTGLIKELFSYDGCYAIRYQRGASVMSVHSWGMAMDFNAALNPFGGPVRFSQSFLQVWRDLNWTCGADFLPPRVDGMHFEYTKFLTLTT